MKAQLNCDLQRILADLEIARKYYDKYQNKDYKGEDGYLKSFFEGQMTLLCRLLDTPTNEFLSMSFDEFKEEYYNRKRKWRIIEVI